MELKDIGEFGFIKRVTKGSIANPGNIIRPIGDDAAVFKPNPDQAILLTTDLLIENIHFLRNKISPDDLGYKAMAVNLSDIAAMGAKPEHAFISIGIPEDMPLDYLDNFYIGLKETAKKYNVNVLGGDTSRSKSGLVINIALTGSSYPDKILYRNTAIPGDKIFSTGFLGNSKAGLHLILSDIEPYDKQSLELIESHNRPYPFVEEGIFLSQCKGVHAAIDVSDGLGSDLNHIAYESNVGYVLNVDAIPVSEALKNFCARFSFNSIDYAISGGEDYVLIFTADSEYARSIAGSYENKFGRKLYQIGEIIASLEKIIVLEDGTSHAMGDTGWDHLSACQL